MLLDHRHACGFSQVQVRVPTVFARPRLSWVGARIHLPFCASFGQVFDVVGFRFATSSTCHSKRASFPSPRPSHHLVPRAKRSSRWPRGLASAMPDDAPRGKATSSHRYLHPASIETLLPFPSRSSTSAHRDLRPPGSRTRVVPQGR